MAKVVSRNARATVLVAIAFVSIYVAGMDYAHLVPGVDFYHFWIVPRILSDHPDANV
jgi:hypothetical protein